MTGIKDVTGTAFVVAEFRAQESTEAEPLYVDPIVPIFLDARTKQAADAISSGFPAAGMNVRIRTRYLDDRLDEQLARGCRQVVILGAGLDTRAVRKQSPEVVNFEIDDVSTLSFKQARLAECGIDAPINFIPGDYVADGVLPLLEAHGFDAELPAFFIWEGNTMYLTRDAVMKILGELRERVRSFSLSFDFMSEEVIAYATGDQGTTGFVERFAAMGAPWHFSLNDLDTLAEEAGLSVVDAATVAELHRAYRPGRPLASIIFQHYSLCTLKHGSSGLQM
jgi:methyltransferase (TIGR00027 family)